MILDKVNMPNDLKKLSLDEMNVLADEMRELIIKKVNRWAYGTEFRNFRSHSCFALCF